MASRADASPTPRTPLSRERVLRAAIAFADENGIDALSMRRLGQELGVEAMSLYNHVANKDDLLDGVVGMILSEMEPPSGGGDWKAVLRRSEISAYGVLRRHPWAAALALSPAKGVSAGVRRAEWMLRRLRDAGFPPELTYHAFHALDGHLWGFTLWELGHSVTADNVGDLAAAFLREFPAEEYPYMHEHVQQHVTGAGRGKNAFEFGLDLILDGLERARDAA